MLNLMFPHPMNSCSSLNLARITALALDTLKPITSFYHATMGTSQNNSNSWKPTSSITSSTHDNKQHQTSLTPTYEMQGSGPAPSSSSNLPAPAKQPHVHSKRERCVCLKFIGVLFVACAWFCRFCCCFSCRSYWHYVWGSLWLLHIG